ncbi:MAG: hypothetical protein U0640_00605 [Phycisphaerales bacterium]
MLAASPPTLPPLAPHLRHVVSRFLALDQCPYAMARDLKCDIFEALEQLADPAVQAWLAFHAHLIATRLRTHAHHALEEVCTTSPNPIERRRAAGRLLTSLNYITRSTPRTLAPSPTRTIPPSHTQPPAPIPTTSSSSSPSRLCGESIFDITPIPDPTYSYPLAWPKSPPNQQVSLTASPPPSPRAHPLSPPSPST